MNKNLKIIISMFLLLISIPVQGISAQDRAITNMVVLTKDVVQRDSQGFNPASGFVSATYTNDSGNVVTTTDYSEFEILDGKWEMDMSGFNPPYFVFNYKFQGETVGSYSHYQLPIGAQINIETKDLEVDEGEVVELEDGFVKMTVTIDGIPKEYNTYDDFIEALGTASSDFTNPVTPGTHTMSYTYVDETVTSTITVKEPVSTVEFTLKDKDLLTTDTFNEEDLFEKMTITNSSGVSSDYSYTQFKDLGGDVDSEIPETLTAGTFPVTFSYDGSEKDATVKITDYSFEAKNVTIKESGTYEIEDSFKELIITHPDLTKESVDYDKFIELGGEVDSNVPQTLTPNIYHTKFTLNGVEKTSAVTVEEDDIVIEITLKEQNLFTTDTFKEEDGFISLVVTTNGVPKTYNFEEFKQKGGVVTHTLANPLVAGTHEVTYEYSDEKEKVFVKVTDYSFDAEDVTLRESETYEIEDSFKELIITHPDLTKESVDYDKFIELGGEVDSNIPQVLKSGNYVTKFTLNGVTKTSQVLVEEDVIVIEINTKELSLNAGDSFNIEDVFVSLVITTNGVAKIYGYEEFVQSGGTVTHDIPNPLVPGSYTITYSYAGFEKTDVIRVKEKAVEEIEDPEDDSKKPPKEEVKEDTKEEIIKDKTPSTGLNDKVTLYSNILILMSLVFIVLKIKKTKNI